MRLRSVVKESSDTWIQPCLNKNDWIPFVTGLRKNPKLGYVDNAHRLQIPPRFDDIFPFENDRALVRIGCMFGMIDRKCNWILPPRFKEVGSKSGGRWRFQNSSGKYGYFDLDGNLVIPAQYEDAEPFYQGFAAVKKFDSDYYGYIDLNGQPLTEFCYSAAYPFKGGRAEVRRGWHTQTMYYGFINKKGEFTLTKKVKPKR